jgi:murein L,D-transpeptidase YcbB/YkuD
MRAFAVLLLALTIAAPAHAAKPRAKKAAAAPRAATAESGAIKSLLSSGRHSDLRWPTFSDVRADLDRMYARRGYHPAWLENARPTAAASSMVERLAGADTLGLTPSDYDAEWLLATAQRLAADASAGPNEQARFDVALSIAAARFVDALEHGRVPPSAMGVQYPAPPKGAPLDAVVDSLRDEFEQAGVLERHQPPMWHYRYLKNALAHYRALENDPSFTTALVLPRDLKPGMKFKDAPRLRRRLVALGDLGPSKPPKARADTIYTQELVAGIKHYQRRHGLDPDGVIWPNTAEELQRPLAENVSKIRLALERWRWLPLPFATPPIVVNVPAFRLYAYRSLPDLEENTLAMDVLVGAADRNATPLFAGSMSYLVFRPYWEVPTELMMDELGPRAAWDGPQLTEQGIVLVKKDGDPNNSLPLTPENLRRLGRDLRMRQLPGPHNVLGRVKFMFPNQHDVYLHDTQVGGLFALARRDFSHGCIRVGDPVALAEFVLRDQPEWNEQSIKDAMDGEDNHRVDIANPVPVFVTYATAAAFADGEVRFYGDIYGLDSKLEAMLKKGYPYGARPSGKSS